MWQKPLHKLLIVLVDIGADIDAGDLVVCIRICRSGYCDVVTRLLHVFFSYPSRVQLVLYSWFTRLLVFYSFSTRIL